MNKWTQKSLEIANSEGYLDKLLNIYPVGEDLKREISEELKTKICEAYIRKDKKELLRRVLDLKKFPFNNSYVASLRAHKELIEKNPRIVDIITDKLLTVGSEGIMELASTPKSDSRKYGHSFQVWLKNEGFPFYGVKDFEKSNFGFLNGSDNKLTEYVKNKFQIKNFKKGIDAVLKKNNKFFIFEAKFLTSDGGTQTNQFEIAMNLAKINKEYLQGIAVLDGIVWFKSGKKMHMGVLKSNCLVLSAFLLKDFIDSL